MADQFFSSERGAEVAGQRSPCVDGEALLSVLARLGALEGLALWEYQTLAQCRRVVEAGGVLNVAQQRLVARLAQRVC